MESPVKPLFENRQDAGRKLIEELAEFQGKPVVVLAIPNGGVPMAAEVANFLNAELDVVITRKIPMPLNPEAGFGAVVDDGTTIIDEELALRIGITRQQIDYQVDKVRSAIRQRNLAYHKDRPLVILANKIIILVDDGLASGLTMQAAVTSLRRRRPREIVIAVPVASEIAINRLAGENIRVITCHVAGGQSFAVADYYHHWRDVSDAEVLDYLARQRGRRPNLRNLR